MNWEDILEEVLDRPDDWKDVISAMIDVVNTGGVSFGDFELLQYLPQLIEKVYNHK